MGITYQKGQFLIDGEPRVLLIAEFHYFRTARDKWREKLELIKTSGVHGIASYIPWLLHEQEEGDFDFTGRYRGEHDLAHFMDLVEEYGFYFIARPGPFIMAEMKNDGIPFWVYDRYPEVRPVSWFGNPANTVTLDYLAPNFLKVAKRYYEHVIPLIASHQYPKGTTIAVQLDNEIGMLSWVSNNPDLTVVVLQDFFDFLGQRYGNQLLRRYPFAQQMDDTFIDAVRNPTESYHHKLHQDLGLYMRQRYSKYVDILAEYATEFGFDQGMFLVNIHGCSAGRGLKYPIGISQLYESYREKPRIISGSDHYLRDFNVPHFVDAYMVNALTAASNGPDQPLTSLEFSPGTGDYGNSFSARYPTSRIDFLTRVFIALNNRILNYYTFIGGRNYRLDRNLGDGNDRIAITGEEHSYAAPVRPDGQPSYTWNRMVETLQLIRHHEPFLADQSLLTDNLEYVFDPDYFMTEYHTPNLPNDVHQNLEMHRAGEMWDNVLKPLLLLNYHFKATNIKTDSFTKGHVLLLPSARYMSRASQEKIVRFLQDGGKMLLYGEVPEYDLEANPCTILMDALGLSNPEQLDRPNWRFRPSIIAKNLAEGRAELHRSYYQTLSYPDESAVFFEAYHNQKSCGFHIQNSGIEAIVITTRYRADLELYQRFMDTLGVSRQVYHDYTSYHGIFLAKTANEKGVSYQHIINLDDFDKAFTLHDGDWTLPIYLEANRALMLPRNLPLGTDSELLYSDSEIIEFSDHHITIRLSGRSCTLAIRSMKQPSCQDGSVSIVKHGDHFLITKPERLVSEATLTLSL